MKNSKLFYKSESRWRHELFQVKINMSNSWSWTQPYHNFQAAIYLKLCLCKTNLIYLRNSLYLSKLHRFVVPVSQVYCKYFVRSFAVCGEPVDVSKFVYYCKKLLYFIFYFSEIIYDVICNNSDFYYSIIIIIQKTSIAGILWGHQC